MTIGNILRKTTLFSLAVLAVYNVNGAWAYNPRTQDDAKPSVEINLDVLDRLAGNPAPGVNTSEKVPFGEPTAATNPMPSGKKASHHKHPKSGKPKPVKHKVPRPASVPEVRAVNPAPVQDEPSSVMVTLPEDKSQSQQQLQLPPSKPQMPDIQSLPSTQGTTVLPALPPATPSAGTPAPKALEAAPVQLQPLPPAGGNTQSGLPPLPAVTNAPVAAPIALPPVPSSANSVNEPAKDLTPAPLPSAQIAPVQLPPAPPPSVAVPPGLPPLPATAPAGSSRNAPAADLVAMPPLPTAPVAGGAPKPVGNAAAPDLQILFGANETDVPLNETGKLDDIALKLIKNPDLRASIIAYASGADAISIYPKRVSLARGIAVRDYLTTARNIDVERVTVKALGNKSESGPADRVDLFLIK